MGHNIPKHKGIQLQLQGLDITSQERTAHTPRILNMLTLVTGICCDYVKQDCPPLYIIWAAWTQTL